MRRHFYGQRDDADHACEVLRTFGFLPFIAVALMDDVTQYELGIDIPSEQSYAKVAICTPEPYEDDFQHSSWWDEWNQRGRRDDRD